MNTQASTVDSALEKVGSVSQSERRHDLGREKRRPIELAVVVPTFNERDNVPELYKLLTAALSGIRWEMIVVDDDSPDGTADVIREMSQAETNVRVIQRIGRRGLSTAVIEGMLATSAEFLAVIDADMQHDERVLPQMLDDLRKGDLDVAVGSRYVDGGGTGEWDSARVKMSALATRVSRLILKSNLSDPMSGFFMIRRSAFLSTVRRLSGEGYKILLDLFASAETPFRFKEYPYEFRTRTMGESKVDTLVLWEYLTLIIDKLVGRYVPARLIMFGAVGGTGVIVHFAIFSTLFFALGAAFAIAQLVATMVAMTTNYMFNNILTYRDARKSGLNFVWGLLGFYLICGVGLLGNVGVASVMYEEKISWWVSALAGIAIGTVWNYAASSIFVWKKGA